MNTKCFTISFIGSIMLVGSYAFAAEEQTNASLEAGVVEKNTSMSAPATIAPTPKAETPAATPAATTVEKPATAPVVPAPKTETPTTMPTPVAASEKPASEAATPKVETTVSTPANVEKPATGTLVPESKIKVHVATPIAIPTVSVDNTKKPLAKLTCEEFLGFEVSIQPKYVIAAEAYAKNRRTKDVVIDVVATEALVPVIIQECGKTPKESFLTKLKNQLKH